MRTRARRALVSTIVIGGTILGSIALANLPNPAPAGGGLTPTSETTFLYRSSSSMPPGFLGLSNLTGGAIQVQSSSGSGSCSHLSATYAPSLPTTVGVASGMMVMPSSTLAAPGIEVCRFTVRDNTSLDVGDYTLMTAWDGGTAFNFISDSGSYPFGTASMTNPVAHTFEAKYVAGAPTTFYAYVTDGNGSYFKITACPGGSIVDNGMGCVVASVTSIDENVEVTCAPSGSGSATKNLIFVAADSPGAYASVSLSCNGSSSALPGMLTVSPNPLNIGAMIGSTGSGDATWTNAGSSSLNMTGATTSGATGEYVLTWGDPNCPNNCTLGPGSSVNMHADFTPIPPAGTHSMMISVANSGSGAGSAMLQINGSGSMTATTDPIISVTPLVHFDSIVGDGPMMMPVTITNTGSASSTLSVSNITTPTSSQFEVVLDGNCQPPAGCTITGGGSAQFDVKFTTVLAGTIGGSLQVISNDTSNGSAQVNLTATTTAPDVRTLRVDGTQPFAFGPHAVNVASSPLQFDLANTGTVDATTISIHAMAHPDVYTVTPSTFSLASGVTKPNISITCKPTMAGDFGDGLEIIATDSGGSGGFTITPNQMPGLSCTGVSSSFSMGPSPIDFKEVRTGTSVADHVITMSTAAPSLAITTGPALAPSADPALSLSSPLPTTIGAGNDGTFQLHLDTSHDVAHLTTTIDAAAADGSTASVSIAGSITTPNATPPPQNLDLGTFCLGRATTSQTAAYHSTGTASIMVGKPTLGMGTLSPFTLLFTDPMESMYTPQYKLPAGATQTVTLHPADETATGDFGDTLTWTSDMPGQATSTTTLAVHFVDSGGALSPAIVDYQPVRVHMMSAPQTLTLQNCGAADLTLMPATIAPGDAFHDVSASPLPATLAPGAKITIDVDFAPVKVGLVTATLTVDSSAGSLTATLQGVGELGTDDGGQMKGFYACGCRTTDPAAGGPFVLVAWALARRRKRRASVR